MDNVFNNCGCGCHHRPTCRDCCHKPKCGCALPVAEVEEMPDSVATLRYNFGGASTWYDHTNMILQTQTDTTIKADALKRALIYMAERHVDAISAKELGSILHIADIGDVDITGIADNALFVYQKNSDCAHGCQGIDNSWKAWNALEHQSTNLDTVMGFDEDGKPYTLQRPASTNKHYLLGWAANDKLKYITLTPFGTLEGKKALYIDPETGEIGYQA